MLRSHKIWITAPLGLLVLASSIRAFGDLHHYVAPNNSNNDAVIITFTHVARYITPSNPIFDLFRQSAEGRCEYFAHIDNQTPYHITKISFRALYSITDMRAMSYYTDDRPMAHDIINAPLLRPDGSGDVHSGDSTYRITGTVNGEFPNCKASVADFKNRFEYYTFVTQCTMDGVTEGQCLSFIHVYLADDFMEQAISADKSNIWINTINNDSMRLNW